MSANERDECEAFFQLTESLMDDFSGTEGVGNTVRERAVLAVQLAIDVSRVLNILHDRLFTSLFFSLLLFRVDFFINTRQSKYVIPRE